LYISVNIPKTVHFSSSFSNKTVANKKTIPNRIVLVNWIKAMAVLGKARLVPMNALANQAAEMLILSPENALRYGWY